jgi:adenosylhomocysteine nucleosidase
MSTWLIVAAEKRELEGILKRAPVSRPLDWPGAAFAREVSWKAATPERWWLIVSGPGPRLVERTLREPRGATGLASIGFCGALDPALGIGDIVITGERLQRTSGAFVQSRTLCLDRVAVTAAEKSRLRATTGAAVIEMESAAVAAKAREWGLPFRAVRSVSDTAGEDMPLDFNQYRDQDGRFSRSGIVWAALGRPLHAIPGLLRLDRNCRLASESLGEFLANCEF